MCLEQIHTKNNRISVKEGYKVFKRDYNNSLVGVFKPFQFKKRRWLVDPKDDSILSRSSFGFSYYPTGFHVFAYKRYALSYQQYDEVVHRVLVKEIVSSGLQQYGEKTSATVICRKLFIMEQVTH